MRKQWRWFFATADLQAPAAAAVPAPVFSCFFEFCRRRLPGRDQPRPRRQQQISRAEWEKLNRHARAWRGHRRLLWIEIMDGRATPMGNFFYDFDPISSKPIMNIA